MDILERKDSYSQNLAEEITRNENPFFIPKEKGIDFPDEIYLQIFSFLDPTDLNRLSQVSRKAYRLAHDFLLLLQYCYSIDTSIHKSQACPSLDSCDYDNYFLKNEYVGLNEQELCERVTNQTRKYLHSVAHKYVPYRPEQNCSRKRLKRTYTHLEEKIHLSIKQKNRTLFSIFIKVLEIEGVPEEFTDFDFEKAEGKEINRVADLFIDWIKKHSQKFSNEIFLDLSRRDIKGPLSSVIGYFSGLEVLDLSRTHVTTLPKSIGLCKNLDILNLSYTDVIEIPEELSSCKELRILQLSGTSISSLQKVFPHKNLEVLEVDKTLITTVEGIFALEKLEKLDLSYTRVKDLSPLSSLKKLEDLKLAKIMAFDWSVLSSLTYLNELNLAYSSIPDVSSISSLKYLESLSLSSTSVKNIAGIVSCKFLKFLYLKHTEIEDIEMVSSFQFLEILDLQKAEVGKLPDSLKTRWGIELFI